jgi:hypothetical protein
MTASDPVAARGTSWDSGSGNSDQHRKSFRYSTEKDDVHLLRHDSTSKGPNGATESNENSFGTIPERGTMERTTVQRSLSVPRRASVAWDGLDLGLPDRPGSSNEKTRTNANQDLSQPPRMPTHTRGRSSPGPYRMQGGTWRVAPQDMAIKMEPNSTSPSPTNDTSDPPHSIFTRKQKKMLVYIVSMAAIFSPLSSNIYFPAVDTISRVGCPIRSIRLNDAS